MKQMEEGKEDKGREIWRRISNKLMVMMNKEMIITLMIRMDKKIKIKIYMDMNQI